MATFIGLERVSSGLFRLTVYRTDPAGTRRTSSVTGRLLALCQLAHGALLAGAEADTRRAQKPSSRPSEPPSALSESGVRRRGDDTWPGQSLDAFDDEAPTRRNGSFG